MEKKRLLNMQRSFLTAVSNDNVAVVAWMLRNEPDLDLSWMEETDENPALNQACISKCLEIVKLLLKHPGIDVNTLNLYDQTPLLSACLDPSNASLHLLLKDPRVNATITDSYGGTPFCVAAYCGHLDVIKWLIASGKDLAHYEPGEWDDDEDLPRQFTPLQAAAHSGRDDVVQLIQRFYDDEEGTRCQIRIELDVQDEFAAKHFASIIFLCESLLRVKGEEKEKESAAARFFTVAQRLPMELQMVLAHCAVGSPKINVLSKDSEPAFRELARALLE